MIRKKKIFLFLSFVFVQLHSLLSVPLSRSSPPPPPLPAGLNSNEVQPDHLEGIRFEKDGDVNPDFRKEIIVGHHEIFDNMTKEQQVVALETLFKRIDNNHDGILSSDEIRDWILICIKRHVDEARVENKMLFKRFDTDKDGWVSWKEYAYQFFLVHGKSPEEAMKLSDVFTANNDANQADSVMDELQRDRFRFVGENPRDDKLNSENFFHLRHPESSPRVLKNLINEIQYRLDENKDGVVGREEFSRLPAGELDPAFQDPKWIEADKRWQQERREEFDRLLDNNHDGIADSSELRAYVDPRNPSHALQEAKLIISLADDNKDGVISVDEFLQHRQELVNSKVVRPDQGLHSEF